MSPGTRFGKACGPQRFHAFRRRNEAPAPLPKRRRAREPLALLDQCATRLALEKHLARGIELKQIPPIAISVPIEMQ
jgi:hypothetical protein